MRKPKFNFPIRLISIIIIIFLGILFIIGFCLKFLKTADCFKIKEIIFKGESVAEVSYLRGENIFNIDVARESQYLAQHYPNYRQIRLVRVLPNRIFIDFIKRNPLAVIKLYRYFYVDKDAVIFDAAEQLEDQDLPIILGLETKIFGPKKGSRYNIKELSVALDIIMELKSNRLLRGYKIKKINVANLNNASFTIEELEIKLDAYNIKEKVAILAGLLNQEKNGLNNINYIDLRFKDPVIKFNDVK